MCSPLPREMCHVCDAGACPLGKTVLSLCVSAPRVSTRASLSTTFDLVASGHPSQGSIRSSPIVCGKGRIPPSIPWGRSLLRPRVRGEPADRRPLRREHRQRSGFFTKALPAKTFFEMRNKIMNHNPRALVSAPVPCHVAALVDSCGLGASWASAPFA